MTRYEKLMNEMIQLVTDGRTAVPGVREKCFTEANRIMDTLDAMPIEYAEEEVGE